MTFTVTIRDAKPSDLAAINSIYNYYVPKSDCTMDLEPIALESRKLWFLDHGPEYPVIVAERDGEVLGWASLSKYRPRAAYRPTVEDTIYVRDDMRGVGIGGALLDELIARAKWNGYCSIMSVICANQSASLKIHQKKGFVEVGHLNKVGYKFDKWVDIKMLQLML
jgi:L-amino acid N-acyltransferase